MSGMNRLLLAILALTPAACAAQAEPDYQGEPLMTIRGAVTTGNSPPSQEMEAALLWFLYHVPSAQDPSDFGLVVGRSRVTGDFPAEFTLEVLEPPPVVNSAFLPRGMIVAIPVGSADQVDMFSILGMEDSAGVVYFAEDGKPDDEISIAASASKVPPRKGYHMWRSEVTEEQEAAYFRCWYDGLCDHEVFRPGTEEQGLGPRSLPINQRREDEDYALCLKYLPDAETCTTDDRDINSAESRRCFDLGIARDQRRDARVEQGSPCPNPRTRLANPQGFDFPVTVTLGRTIHDVWLPRYHE